MAMDNADLAFAAAQEALKALSFLDNASKLKLYAHYKQATVGPAQGSRPSMFNQVARAKWDAWSQLGSLSATEAKRGYCFLADEFVPGWREAFAIDDAAQSEEAAVQQPTDRAVLRNDDEDSLFEAAQEAVKSLPSLDDTSKLKLYAHYKQATVGPAQGSRPSMFSQVARAKWDAWSQLGSMSATEAKRGYCFLADEFVPGWREAFAIDDAAQSEEAAVQQPTDRAVLQNDDEDSIFQEAQEAVKSLPSLDDTSKLKLYAHYKQATMGPAQGSRPSILNQVARAKWDAWSQLGGMSATEAKRGYCFLADEFVPGWREAFQIGDASQTPETVPDQQTDRAVLRNDDEDSLFEAAQEAVKSLPSLDDTSKLKLYAHYKQATVGPAQGSRPSIFNQVARAKWDAWSQLGSMSATEAKRGYCFLADEFVPGWREAFQIGDASQTPETVPDQQTDRAVLRNDDEDSLFEAAQEAVKSLPSLDDTSKLQLYAHYKQATAGPVQGCRPSMFNQVARAKWDAWSQLSSMSATEAKRGYCWLVDEFVPGWREAFQIGDASQTPETVPDQQTDRAVLRNDDEDSLFEAAQEAVKSLPSLDDTSKLKLYARYKQATVGPAQGSRPSIFNQVARAKWEAWSQLGSMSATEAKRGYCFLADEFVPGWREAFPIGDASQTLESVPDQQTDRAVLRNDDEDSLFEAAQEAVKSLPSLDDTSKLKLYAHYKQATMGPAQGSRPSIFNQVARAKWDAWSQLGSMSATEAKRGYCFLADEFVPGWREAFQIGDASQTPETVPDQQTDRAVLRNDDEDSLFEAAQEAVKSLPSLDDTSKLKLYAHYKQATMGPAQGSRPSILNQVARAKWDAWSQLGSMSATEAKRGYCFLADEFVPNWRMQSATVPSPASAVDAMSAVATEPLLQASDDRQGSCESM